MDETRQDDGEIFEAVGFLNHFSDLTDGRQAGKVVYPLDEVLLLALLAVLAGAETFTDIARFGEKKLPCCDASARSRTVRRRTTGSARSSQPWTPTSSSAVSSPGWPR